MGAGHYDKTGNRTSATSSGTTSYTYPTTSHRLSQVGTAAARGYDAAGNTTSIPGTIVRNFVYDDHGRMTTYNEGATTKMSYVYNGKGEQVRKSASSTTNAYSVYDEAGKWLGEYDNAGIPTQQTIWLDDLPVGLLVGAGASQKLHYLEPDMLGTPRVVVDPTRGTNGTAIWTWDLAGEAFGTTAPNQNPDGDATDFVFDMRFPGQRYDSASGLNYNYFRDYEPTTGRYVESDPIGLDGGISTFSFVEQSPFVSSDPLGLQRVIVVPWWWPPAIPFPGSEQKPNQDYSKPDPWERVTAPDGSTARDWGRSVGRSGRNGKWCVMKCKGEENGVSGRGRTLGECKCPDFIYGLGKGSTENEAWNNAWDAANNNTPKDCMKKHCSGLAGSCRGRKGGKAK